MAWLTLLKCGSPTSICRYFNDALNGFDLTLDVQNKLFPKLESNYPNIILKLFLHTFQNGQGVPMIAASPVCQSSSPLSNSNLMSNIEIQPHPVTSWKMDFMSGNITSNNNNNSNIVGNNCNNNNNNTIVNNASSSNNMFFNNSGKDDDNLAESAAKNSNEMTGNNVVRNDDGGGHSYDNNNNNISIPLHCLASPLYGKFNNKNINNNNNNKQMFTDPKETHYRYHNQQHQQQNYADDEDDDTVVTLDDAVSFDAPLENKKINRKQSKLGDRKFSNVSKYNNNNNDNNNSNNNLCNFYSSSF
ncbi:hypothetical protein HELRODRAFT_194096 [Helobdella robusta]|uniref:Uncharacterized protein n=1 Tax=Helobdella robusta TaxID=6412 RepID=T1FVN8_HELRO|nr:hypothetical protein HELRODRAFT_194096 [Helobdella robusta]ESN93434.1 hypothetical protein HELRODRAFT_194096 [Helobdella robusta]